MPHLTVSGEGSKAGAQYVAMLYIDTAVPASAVNITGTTALATGVFYWTLGALLGSSQNSLTTSWIDQQDITADQLSQLLCYFNTRANNEAPFNYLNDSGNDIQHFLKYFFTVSVVPVDVLILQQWRRLFFRPYQNYCFRRYTMELPEH